MQPEPASPSPGRWVGALLLSAVCGALLLMAVPARSVAPLVDTALAEAKIGEQSDGYLGFVDVPSEELRKAVVDINIRRRQGYTLRALEKNVTVAEFAAATGCQALRRVPVGRAYRVPEGPWRIRQEGEAVSGTECN